jgi:hypothetical protein
LPSGSGEDNFGGHADALVSTADVAARDIVFTIISGTSSFGASASGLMFDFTAGKLDYSYTRPFPLPSPVNGSQSLSNSDPAPNAASSPMLRTFDSIHETVVVPIDFKAHFQVIVPTPPPDTELRFQGAITARRLRADFDQDQDADGVDFLRWQAAFGQAGAATHSQGDTDGDLDVDQDDLAAWRNSYGVTQASASSGVATPEPASGTLVIPLIAASVGRVIRRRTRGG